MKMRVEEAAVLVVLLFTVVCGNHAQETQAKEEGDGRVLFGAAPYSTTTYTVVSVSTSTANYICYSGIVTNKICKGRRKRNIITGEKRLIRDLEHFESSSAIESTKNEMAESVKPSIGKSVEPEDRLIGFTVWTTALTTTSVTTISTDTATTIRMSFACIIGGADYPNYNSCG
ncbi:unnamed protein product [Meganyctiphanes norvegica]|uniref:Uncharacterized protein n=1 Tax=Meganyctiphanes norvegica TaxID=48144 RepID=A0AAV2PT06_MEGNR